MNLVYKCDYCRFMGSKEEVAEHEPSCMDNYDRRSCFTCQHRGKLSMLNNLVKYECGKGIDIPAGKIFEFCKSYERKEKSKYPHTDFWKGLFV